MKLEIIGLAKKRIILVWMIVILMIISFILPLVACSSSQRAQSGLKVSIPWDLYNFAEGINGIKSENTGIPTILMQPSDSPLNDLKQGKSQAALIGKEPTAEDMKGLKDYVVGYDAVCILIDANSYFGGEYWQGVSSPVSKTDGLRYLSAADVKSLISYSELAPSQRWAFQDYFTFTASEIDDPTGFKSWVKRPLQIDCAVKLHPGKYDTQAVLFKMSGLDEHKIASTWEVFTSTKFHREEEILSGVFPEGSAVTAIPPTDYKFLLGFASRQVTQIALRHVQVRVVAIDGIDPLEDIESIYNGTYKFSRKIHFLIRENSLPAETQLANFMQTAEAQAVIEKIGYLPILDKQ